MREHNKLLAEKDKVINKELLKQYFRNQSLVDMQKDLCKPRNTYRKRSQADLIKNGLEKFKDDIKEMSEDKIKIEKPNEIINSVEKILDFNYLNQEGQGLKILTPQQMLSRLPITLAQLQAGITHKHLRMK